MHAQSDRLCFDAQAGLRFVSVSSDGRWLLARTVQDIQLIDLTNGRTQSSALPPEAVIARWQ